MGQNDIPGYSGGKYRSNQVHAIQAESRWRFSRKFGMIGFLGIATAIEGLGKIAEDELSPVVRLEFRFMIIPSERINVRKMLQWEKMTGVCISG